MPLAGKQNIRLFLWLLEKYKRHDKNEIQNIQFLQYYQSVTKCEKDLLYFRVGGFYKHPFSSCSPGHINVNPMNAYPIFRMNPVFWLGICLQSAPCLSLGTN